MRNFIRALNIISLVLVLGACGNSGSDSEDETSGVSFTVSLTSIDIRRVSNGGAIDVNTASITSGTLTFNQ